MKFLFFALVLLSSVSLFAANPNANINSGNVTVGGGLSFSYNASPGYTLYTNPTFQYFLADNFSVGGRAFFQSTFNSSGSVLGVGPAATYYFWSQDKLAASVGADVLQVVGPVPGYVVADLFAGLNWFIIPSVAFGPTLEYSHYFESPLNAYSDVFYLLGSFAVYF